MTKTGLLLASITTAILIAGSTFAISDPQHASHAQVANPARPNILFILADDMKARELQYMPNTQSLLAGQGVNFTEAYVTRSLCCPSRATILRGQYTHNHKVWTNVNPSGGFWNFYDYGLDNSTIATWLDDPNNFADHVDYDTVLIGKYLNRYGLDRSGNYSPTTYVPPGWDEWYAWEGNYNSDDTYDINEWKSSDGQPQGHIVTYQRSQIHDTDLHAQVAEDFIRRTAGDERPFFMYLAPNAPHAPAYYAPRHATRFSNEPLPRPSSFNETDVSDKPQWVQDKPLLSSAQISDMTRFYRNRLRALQAVDEMVGRLVGTLSDTGELSNTYIVFTSDNGIYLGEHRLQNKAAAYNASPSVPLVIRGPGVPQGKTRSKTALNNDFAPTFASWAGVTQPAFVDGRSLEPLLTESPPADWRSGGFLVEHRRAPEEYDYVRDIPNYEALRTARYHYVEYETGEKELYDDKSDPTELDNLLAPNAPPPDPMLLSILKKQLDGLKSCAGSNCTTAEEDTTPPVLDLSEDITDEATGPDGAKIGWPSPTAIDLDPTYPEVTCTPPSDNTFPLGRTTVACTATDAVGNKAQGSFDVAVVDTTTPTISLEAPADGAHIGGTIALSANASDVVGVSRVEFLVDGVVVGSDDTGVPYSFDWDSSTVADGQVTITAKAYDAADNVATDSHTVTVENMAPEPPTVDLEAWSDSGISETDNTTNITTPSFVGTAPPGSMVELFDGNISLGEVSADDQEGSWSFEAPTLGEGLHQITAKATDVEGRTSALSDALVVRIDTTAPETTIDSGPVDATNKTTATFEFSASEADSIFLGILDEDSYEEISSPTTYANLSNGEHTFRVRAEDVAGNTDASPATYTWEFDALKPTATAPVQALNQGEELGDSLIPVSLEWSAVDNPGGSGVALYELMQSKDGAPYSSVALADPTATTNTLSLERGSTYRYMVRAQDKAGNWSAWAAGPRFTLAAHQENSTALSYPSGIWTRSTLSGAYGGYVKYAKAQGATVHLTFTGRNIAWVATKAPGRGTAEVYIDGTQVATVDLYAATTQTRTIVFSEEWSASNSHTITIKVLGAPTGRPTVDVDAFVELK
jgi:N-acetylglucosamine-6-sulfatase